VPEPAAQRRRAVVLRVTQNKQGHSMPIKINKEAESRMIESLTRYFLEEMDSEIGDLRASLLLDYIIREIGPTIYNLAVSDAQAIMTERVNDLDGTCYEQEFTFWER